MTALLEKALQKVGALPEDEQNAIASEILDSLADEEAWKSRLAAKRPLAAACAGSASGGRARRDASPGRSVLIESRTTRQFASRPFGLTVSSGAILHTQVCISRNWRAKRTSTPNYSGTPAFSYSFRMRRNSWCVSPRPRERNISPIGVCGSLDQKMPRSSSS